MDFGRAPNLVAPDDPLLITCLAQHTVVDDRIDPINPALGLPIPHPGAVAIVGCIKWTGYE
jgi:hypothetical protein